MRKEERKKAEKEKLLQETDPDKTRKWEVQELMCCTKILVVTLWWYNAVLFQGFVFHHTNVNS